MSDDDIVTQTIFLSGILCDHELWDAQIEALSDITQCQYLAPEGPSIADMATSVLRVAPEKFHLCASSMGGYIAMEIASMAPDRLQSLVLSNTSARSDEPKQRSLRLSTIEEIRSGKFDTVVDRLLPVLVSPKNRGDVELLRRIRTMMQRVGPETTLNQQIATLNRRDFRASLPEISVPSLVISCADDRVTPPEHGQEIAALLDGSQFQLLQEAGHLSSIEVAGQITALIRDWRLN